MEAPASQQDAETVNLATLMMDAVRQNDITTQGQAWPDTAIANSVKQDLVTGLTRDVADLRGAGLIEPADARDWHALVNTQAFRSNNTISTALDSL